MIDWFISHPWMSLAAILAVWLGIGFIVGPILGRFCGLSRGDDR